MSQTNRLKIFGNEFVELNDFARSVKKHPRTVKRWGLPTTKIGNIEAIHLPSARQRLLDKMSPRNRHQ